MANFDQEIDVTGERCPVPVFKTQKALNTMKSGEILHIITDDPVSMQNMASFIEINSQYELLDSKQEGRAFFYLIKKS
jgi:tRNA 2-thiouridine synthesizing protein A